jgi:VanZ family protein
MIYINRIRGTVIRWIDQEQKTKNLPTALQFIYLNKKEVNHHMSMKQVISWLSVLLWMSLIFYLSHQPAAESTELSAGVMQLLLASFEVMIPFIQINIDSLHFLIRKGAHFTAYFILGILLIHALRTSGTAGMKAALMALLLSVLYAVTDEIHQLFIPGRSGEVRDVLIDSVGAAVGIGFYLLYRKMRTK